MPAIKEPKAPKEKKTNYLDPQEFREEMLKSREQDELTPKAVQMFRIMSHENAKRRTYKFEEDREDCVACGVLDCLLYWRGWDPEKGANCFAYFTTVVYNGLQKGWKRLNGKIKYSQKVSLSHQNLYNI